MLYRIYSLFLFFFLSRSLSAQIVDDSTRQIYGLSSVQYQLEKDILTNKTKIYHPDSTLGSFALVDTIAKSTFQFQHLGNLGTAAKWIGWRTEEEVNTPLYFSPFGLYGFQKDQIRYFNTKSPFTNMHYVQGSRNFAVLDFTHSQNINERLNITLDINRFSASKQFGLTGSSREERLVDHWAVHVSSNYTDKKGKYLLLTHYNHLNHKQNEQGGVQGFETLDLSLATISPEYTDYQAQLVSAYSREYWNDWHIYHQYKLAKKEGFTLFHQLDYGYQKMFFIDAAYGRNKASEVYPTSNSVADTAVLFVRYRSLDQSFGLKGNWKGFGYNAYLNPRFYRRIGVEDSRTTTSWQFETFVGGRLNYATKDSALVLQTHVKLGTNGGFLLIGKGAYRRFGINFKQIRRPTTLFEQTFFSEFVSWSSDFNQTFTQELGSSFPISAKPTRRVELYGNYVLALNAIYWDTQSIPQQAPTMNYFEGGLDANFLLKKWRLAPHASVRLTDNDLVLRVPLLTAQLQAEYYLTWAKKLDMTLGSIIHYKSAYYANAYQPMTQQFILQDEALVWGVPVIDVYTAFMINRVKLSFSFTHANKGVLTNGYFVSPTYLGLGRSFTMQVNWPLFD
ncbi:MAG: putative porin [Spirosomataceae bacterium]